MDRFRSLVLALCVACSLIGTSAWSDRAPRLPNSGVPIPVQIQETDYSCGPATLLGVLKYWGVFAGPESDLYPLLNTTEKDGTEPSSLAKGAASFGLEVEMRDKVTLGDIRQALSSGITTIVAMQAWREELSKSPWETDWIDGHYAAVVGMDDRYIYLMDTSAEGFYAYVPRQEFLDKFHDMEDRNGYAWRYHHLAIFIKGKRPAVTEFQTRELIRQN